MVEWHCFKCEEEMIDAEILMEYLDIEGEANGVECPKCGTKYILEEEATTRMAKGEKMIENK